MTAAPSSGLLAPAWEVGGPWGPRYPWMGVAGRKRREVHKGPPPSFCGDQWARRVGGASAASAEVGRLRRLRRLRWPLKLGGGRGQDGEEPRRERAARPQLRSLSGTRESLAPGPDAATADELSSLGSDSETNGFAERRIDKFGFIVGSQGAEGA